MKITNISKFYISGILTYTHFWISIAVPFKLSKGLDLEQAFAVVAFYSLCAVILEYPTGVIGDHFGHKKSVALGNIMSALALSFLLFNTSLPSFYFTMFIMAISSTLMSGSDTALLKVTSENFKKDLPNYSSMVDFVLFFAAILGGIIGSYSFELAIIISSITSFLAGLIVLTIKIDESYLKHNSGNIFSTAGKGIKAIIDNKKIFIFFCFIVIIMGFSRSIKSLFGSFPEVFDLDVRFVGILVGFGMLSRAIGTKFTNQININSKILNAGLLFILLLGVFDFTPLIPILSLICANFIIGLIKTRMEIELNEFIPDNLRAGVLSLNTLLIRLYAGFYLFVAGYILKLYGFRELILLTSTLFGVFFVVYLIANKIFRKNRKK